jgi:hypothetical protein
MEVLRLVALAVLSSLVLSLLLLGTQLLSSLSSRSREEKAMLSLQEALEALKATGSPQTVELDLPGELLLENGWIRLGGRRLEVGCPVRGGPFRGRCTLELRFENLGGGWEVVAEER